MRRVLSALSLALLLSGPLWAQEATTSLPAPTYQISEPELTRLLAISTQLRALSVSLSDRLATSQEVLTWQSTELRALKLELADLKLTIEQSATLSDSLRVTLAESERSLSSLTASFDEYRRAAKGQIRLWRIVAVGGVLAGIALAVLF